MPYGLNVNGVLPGGRLTVFREPQPNRSYCLGLDFAEGLEHGDASAGVMLDEAGQQVLTVTGQWGSTAFGKILRPVCRWYEPFIVGERNHGGLEVLRDLYSRGFWCYFERDEKKRGRPVSDRLGHAAVEMDPPVASLRGAIGPRDENGNLRPPRVTIRDAELHQQLMRFGYRPRSSAVQIEAARDRQLTWGAPAGEHDDLVRACALAWWGLGELPQYERPKPKYSHRQLGRVLDHEAVLEPPRRRLFELISLCRLLEGVTICLDEQEQRLL